MSVIVHATTDQVPELLDVIERRHADGLDWFDEWWQGVYRVVTGPTPEHGQLTLALGALLLERGRRRGLSTGAPINIGTDKWDARVPDVAVYRPDTERTSPAFLSTAEIVVEILSPSERAGEQLDFSSKWGVEEYLEIDLTAATVRLLARRADGWRSVTSSAVVELTVAEVAELL